MRGISIGQILSRPDPSEAELSKNLTLGFSNLTLALYRGGAPTATALAAAFRLFVFAARLRADFSFRFRTAFFAADILTVRMSILSGRSYAPFTATRWGYV